MLSTLYPSLSITAASRRIVGGCLMLIASISASTGFARFLVDAVTLQSPPQAGTARASTSPGSPGGSLDGIFANEKNGADLLAAGGAEGTAAVGLTPAEIKEIKKADHVEEVDEEQHDPNKYSSDAAANATSSTTSSTNIKQEQQTRKVIHRELLTKEEEMALAREEQRVVLNKVKEGIDAGKTLTDVLQEGRQGDVGTLIHNFHAVLGGKHKLDAIEKDIKIQEMFNGMNLELEDGGKKGKKEGLKGKMKKLAAPKNMAKMMGSLLEELNENDNKPAGKEEVGGIKGLMRGMMEAMNMDPNETNDIKAHLSQMKKKMEDPKHGAEQQEAMKQAMGGFDMSKMFSGMGEQMGVSPEEMQKMQKQMNGEDDEEEETAEKSKDDEDDAATWWENDEEEVDDADEEAMERRRLKKEEMKKKMEERKVKQAEKKKKEAEKKANREEARKKREEARKEKEKKEEEIRLKKLEEKKKKEAEERARKAARRAKTPSLKPSELLWDEL